MSDRRTTGGHVADDVSLRSQLRVPGYGLAAMLGAGGLLLLVTFGAAELAGIHVSVLTRDPSAVAKQPFYVGLLSNLGVLLWAAAGGVLLLGCAVLKRSSGWSEPTAFLAFLAAMTWVLAFDDVFMLHEDAYRRVLPGPEQVVLSFHVVLMVAGLYGFRRTIRRSQWLPLAVALGFFGISVVADAFRIESMGLAYLLEDGGKLLGIVAWTYYASAQTLRALDARAAA